MTDVMIAIHRAEMPSAATANPRPRWWRPFIWTNATIAKITLRMVPPRIPMTNAAMAQPLVPPARCGSGGDEVTQATVVPRRPPTQEHRGSWSLGHGGRR
jgi:hypothetical protein